MSLSLGSDQPSQAETEAFQRAADGGILTFAASGNNYSTDPVDGLAFPAALPTVVCVGAVDSSGQVADFSQRGAGLKIVAPGMQTLSTIVGEAVTTDDGRVILGTLPSADGICFPNPTAAGTPFVFCGLGGPTDFPQSVTGKIALIERGTYKFWEKAQNAKNAGAVAAVVYNNTTGLIIADFSEVTDASIVAPFVTISQDDGLALRATPGARLSLAFGLPGYATLQGTSMATPHAAAAAALLWSMAPDATASQIENAMLNTARDLGAPGYDTTYGFGLVDVLAAAKVVAPQFFGPHAPTGRPFPRRGR